MNGSITVPQVKGGKIAILLMSGFLFSISLRTNSSAPRPDEGAGRHRLRDPWQNTGGHLCFDRGWE